MCELKNNKKAIKSSNSRKRMNQGKRVVRYLFQTPDRSLSLQLAYLKKKFKLNIQNLQFHVLSS
jgi:hypothetical protein